MAKEIVAASELIPELDRYSQMFGESFPLMHSDSLDQAKKHLDECIAKNKNVNALFPKQYGACIGKQI